MVSRLQQERVRRITHTAQRCLPTTHVLLVAWERRVFSAQKWWGLGNWSKNEKIWHLATPNCAQSTFIKTQVAALLVSFSLTICHICHICLAAHQACCVDVLEAHRGTSEQPHLVVFFDATTIWADDGCAATSRWDETEETNWCCTFNCQNLQK